MSITDHDFRLDEVSEAKARAELMRLLADPRFRVTERHRAILTYLSNLHFCGESDGAKAYAIAIDVLGRNPGFDPALDPIVRIELSRLRSALEAYYGAFGHENTVWLEIPRGRYVLRFIPAEHQPSSEEPAPQSDIVEPPICSDDAGTTAVPPSKRHGRPVQSLLSCSSASWQLRCHCGFISQKPLTIRILQLSRLALTRWTGARILTPI